MENKTHFGGGREHIYALHVMVGMMLVLEQGWLALARFYALSGVLLTGGPKRQSWEMHVCDGVRRQIWHPFRCCCPLLPLLRRGWI